MLLILPRRVLSLERRLSSSPQLYLKYKNFIGKLLEMGRMYCVPDNAMQKPPNETLLHTALLCGEGVTDNYEVAGSL